MIIDYLKTAVPALAALLALGGCKDSASAADADVVAVSPAASMDLLPEPPMWSVSDADSEVILYPTVHVLPAGLDWQSERLDAALSRAEEVWYELPAGALEDPATQQIALQLGMGETLLSETIPADLNDRLNAKLAEMGLPAGAFEPMRPWMAAITLPSLQLMQAGYTGEEGVETRLQSRAEVAALGQRGLETAEQQLRFFADLDEDAQIQMLDEAITAADEGVAMIDSLAKAWATGDVATLETEFITEMKQYPDLYDTLIVRRNADWAEQLDAEMKGKGVDFVAVGAGHLVGPDSVPAMMAAKGYEVRVLTAR